MAYLQFILVCLFFGSNFMLMDRANRWFGPLEVGMGRLFCGGIVLGLVWLLFERGSRVRWSDARNIAIVSLIAFASPYVIQPTLIGQGYGHSFFGTTIAFTPLLTILVSIPMLGIKPSARQLVGVLLGLVFISMLMTDGGMRGIPPLILAFAFAVPLCYAVGNTWMGRTLSDVPPAMLSCVVMLTAGLILSPIFFSPPLQEVMHMTPPVERTAMLPAIGALLILGGIGTGLCALAFVRLVQTEGPLFAGMVTYVVPVIAMMWGVFDGEEITTLQMVAIGGIFLMVGLVQAPAKPKDDLLPKGDSPSKEDSNPTEQALPSPALVGESASGKDCDEPAVGGAQPSPVEL